MDLVCMSDKELFEWRRKRHAHFTSIVKDYTSFDDFVKDWDEKMALWGIEVTKEENYVSLRMQFDFSDYECYHVIMGPDGHLAMSGVIWCEELCANMLVNIFTENYVDEEDITTTYGQ